MARTTFGACRQCIAKSSGRSGHDSMRISYCILTLLCGIASLPADGHAAATANDLLFCSAQRHGRGLRGTRPASLLTTSVNLCEAPPLSQIHKHVLQRHHRAEQQQEQNHQPATSTGRLRMWRRERLGLQAPVASTAMPRFAEVALAAAPTSPGHAATQRSSYTIVRIAERQAQCAGRHRLLSQRSRRWPRDQRRRQRSSGAPGAMARVVDS